MLTTPMLNFQRGVVKLRIIATRVEIEVNRAELVAAIRSALADQQTKA